MAELPIIVLAFANEQEGRRYLRDLPEELRRLQDILRDAERNGLCRLEVLSNATLDQIFEVFTRNRDQVTILHYAGHADSGRLLLESSAAGGAPAHAAGLATFLGQRGGLRLVFLNGCSTRAQIARLLEAGVAAVIATARAIDDGMARAFAVAFYTELASGAPLRAAYEAARGRVLAAHDTVPEAYYGQRDLGSTSDSASPDPTDDHGFPWEFRPGDELVERWSLPDAAGNPEFGLPRLPERDLPERPFRNLSWFTAEHAEVFFGRGYQVRELYQQVTDPTGPPILLLYGASGVGKSSLLDAGLVPRMETGGDVVRYCRRDQQKGLSGSLRVALQLGGEQTTLDEGWRAEEARLGKALFVFLDQVEEVFTRPNLAQPQELDEFLAALAAALGNRDTRPRGKLVLGFRKEWLAELDRRLAEAKLPRAKVFLKQLDRRGIIEAIRGPARPGRLQRQYRLAIEDGLPEVIADDLLADAGSALAPTLEVLLTKMWERARQTNPDQPRFDRALYESLKAEGYLLKDVLDEGLKAIGRWYVVVEESGLALDVLVYHTTDLGTASQHTRAELDQRYAHQADALDGLLGRCKDQYLLIEAESRPGEVAGSTRLAHDLLAPLVQQRFRLSVAPGQRARRLLENRAPEWEAGRTGTVLDSIDLSTVEAGASGMRAWDADENHTGETRLVEASRREHARRRLTRQILRAVAAAAVVAICVSGAIAWWERGIARKQAGIAAEKTKIAQEKTRLAEQNLRIAKSRQLAASAINEIDKRQDTALLLGVEALAENTNHESRSILFRAVTDKPRSLTFLHGSRKGKIQSLTFSPDCKTLAAGLWLDRLKGGILLWDVESGQLRQNQPFLPTYSPVSRVFFSPGGDTLALVNGSQLDIRAVNDDRPRDLGTIGTEISSVVFHPQGKTVAVGAGSEVRFLDLSGGQEGKRENIRINPAGVGALAFSPDGHTLAVSTGWNVLLFGEGRQQPKLSLPVLDKFVKCLAYSPDGGILAAGYRGGVVFWDLRGKPPYKQSELLIPNEVLQDLKQGEVTSVIFGNDHDTLAVVYVKYHNSTGFSKVVLLDRAGRQGRHGPPLAISDELVSTIAFSHASKPTAAGICKGGGAAMLWDMTSEEPFRSIFAERDRGVGSMAYDREGVTLAIQVGKIGERSQVVIRDLTGNSSPADRTIFPESWISSVTLADGTKRTLFTSAFRVLLTDPWWERLSRNLQDVSDQSGFIEVSRDGRTLVFARDDDTMGFKPPIVRLWRRLGNDLVEKTLNLPNRGIYGLAFSPDGGVLAAASSSGIVLLDSSGRRITEQPLVAPGNRIPGGQLAFRLDGKVLAAAVEGGIMLWDDHWRPLRDEPISVPGNVGSLAFSPDGKTLVGSGIMLWDDTWQPLSDRPLASPVESSSLALRPDGKILLVQSHGKLYESDIIDNCSLVARARRIANRNLSWDEWQKYFYGVPYRRTFHDLPDGEGVAEALKAQGPAFARERKTSSTTARSQ